MGDLQASGDRRGCMASGTAVLGTRGSHEWLVADGMDIVRAVSSEETSAIPEGPQPGRKLSQRRDGLEELDRGCFRCEW